MGVFDPNKRIPKRKKPKVPAAKPIATRRNYLPSSRPAPRSFKVATENTKPAKAYVREPNRPRFVDRETGIPFRVEHAQGKHPKVHIVAHKLDSPSGPIYYKRAIPQRGRSDVQTKNWKLELFKGWVTPVIGKHLTVTGKGTLDSQGKLNLKPNTKVKIGKLPEIDYSQPHGRDLLDATVGGIKFLNKNFANPAAPPHSWSRQASDFANLLKGAGRKLGNIRVGDQTGLQAGGFNPKLKDVIHPITHGIATGGAGAFKGLAVPQHEIYKALGVKSGAELAQKVGVDKRFGLLPDLVADPVMVAGVIAAPETGGASLALVAAKLRTLGVVGETILKSADVVNASKAVALTRRAEDAKKLEALLHEKIAADPEVAAAFRKISNRDAQRALREVRAEATGKILNKARAQNEAAPTITGRGRFGRKITEKVSVPGTAGTDAVIEAAQSIGRTGLTRPGLRLQFMTPFGRTMIKGRKLPGLDIPLPAFARVPVGRKTAELARRMELQRGKGAIHAEAAPKLQALDEQILNIRKTASIPRAEQERLIKRLKALKSETGRHVQADIHALERGLRAKAGKRSLDLGTLNEIRNFHKIARTVNPAADEFGRMVSNRYMRSIHTAITPLPKKAAARQRSLERVDLLMRAMYETGGAEKALIEKAGFNFTPAEREVAQNLRTIYDEYLRHGQEMGVFGNGLEGGHYVPRVWLATDKAESTRDVVSRITDNLTGGVGSHSSFLHQRVHPETFTLHGRESLKANIARLSDNPNLDDQTLEEVANILHEHGQMKLAGNLIIRGLQRGRTFKLGEDPIIDRAYGYLEKMAPKRGQSITPMVVNEDGLIRFSDHDLERHYDIRKDLFDHESGKALSQEAKQQINLALTTEDLNAVRQVLDDAQSVHLDPQYHAFLEDQNKQLANEALGHIHGEDWSIRPNDIHQPDVATGPSAEQIRPVHDAIQSIDPKYRDAKVTVITERQAALDGHEPGTMGYARGNHVFIVGRTEDEWRALWNKLLINQRRAEQLPTSEEDFQRMMRDLGEAPPRDVPSDIEPPSPGWQGDQSWNREVIHRLPNPENHWDVLTHIEENGYEMTNDPAIPAAARTLFNGDPMSIEEMKLLYRHAISHPELPGYEALGRDLKSYIDEVSRNHEGDRMIDMGTIPERKTGAKRGEAGPPVPDLYGSELPSILAEKRDQMRGYGKGKLSAKARRENIDPATGKPFSDKIPKWGLPNKEYRSTGRERAVTDTLGGLTYDQWRKMWSPRQVLIHEYTHPRTLTGDGILAAPEAASRGSIASKVIRLPRDPHDPFGDPVEIWPEGLTEKNVQKAARTAFTKAIAGGVDTTKILDRSMKKLIKYNGGDQIIKRHAEAIDLLLKNAHPGYQDIAKERGVFAEAVIEAVPRIAQILGHDEQALVKILGEKDAKFMKDTVLGMQSGLSLERVRPDKLNINEDGIAWIMDPKGVPPNGRPPHWHGADAFEDPFNYSQFLPDMRDENMEIILDPRRANYYRTRSEGVIAATIARIKAIDETAGRSALDAERTVTLPDGQKVKAAELRQAGPHETDGIMFFEHIPSGEIYNEGEITFHEPTLIPNTAGDRFYDPVSHQEYIHPNIPAQEGQSSRVMTVPRDRLWPTETVDAFQMELGQAGRYDRLFYSGMDGMTGVVLANIRYGVTTPFPAYHVRNMVSDMLKSLQADTGVLFHPIANAHLSAIAFGKRQGMIDIPGHGKWPIEDFLFMADSFGLNSGHHVAEIYRLMEANQWNETTARQMLHKASLIGPNSRFGQTAIHFGNNRENVMRFITFMQRMRRNGGDAADAAMYMIRHHFNYSDLSQNEKRFMRNIFLFYTWYRKNIPLQLIELARRPGFFAGIAHTYSDFSQGETPLNQDYSKIAPWLPDLSGALPKQNLLPSYFANQLGALEGNWNGHSMAVGFGAPWADLAILRLNKEGGSQVLSMMNPGITTAYSLLTQKDTLTQRDLMANEPSGQATLIDHIERLAGHKLPRDKNGQPVLPWWVDRFVRNVPIAGRAFGSIGAPTDPKRDPGRAQSLSRTLSPILGLNVFIGPEPGGKRATLQQKKAAAAVTAGFNDFKRRISNLPADQRKAMEKAKQKELEAQWKAQGLPLRILYNAHGWPKPKWAQKKRGRPRKIGNYSSGRSYFPGSGSTGGMPGSGGF